MLGSKGLFEKIWRAHDEIVQHGARGHPTCQICGKYQVDRDALHERTDSYAVGRRAELDAAYEAHQMEHTGERKYAETAWFQGETYPKRMTTIRIDAPTQHQFDLPRQRKIARDVVKTLDGAKRWSSKITGAQIAGVGMLATVARAALGGGPNLVCTVLMLCLMAMTERKATLGARLMLVLDNTTAENKNTTVIGFLACMVQWDWFEEAGFFSQPVGHTFNELDQSFNTLIKKMMQYAIYTVSRMISLIWQFLAPYGIFSVVELPYLWNFDDFVSEHMHGTGGFATSQFGEGMHEFRIKKDREGVVRLHMRQSSQASGYVQEHAHFWSEPYRSIYVPHACPRLCCYRWLPEGPGYVVFKTIPEMREPKRAKFKKDDEWKRSRVESTIKQWFPYMALQESERERTRREWITKYFSLPRNMAVSEVQEGFDDLVWRPLPKHIPQTFTQEWRPIPHPSARLENPPVDPTYGFGRSTYVRDREVEEFRAAMRHESEANNTITPVFQADYLLVQFQGSPITLHSVSNGVILHRATDADLSFTTVEYEHTPQEGVHGLWGTFRKKLNPEHDPRNPKSGAKFVRHLDVTRDHVVVFNAAVWLDPHEKALRIHRSTLQERGCPAAFHRV